ncbi:hypothetical protein MBLNU230_g0409t1 [Neophaeotheca triangularis]
MKLDYLTTSLILAAATFSGSAEADRRKDCNVYGVNIPRAMDKFCVKKGNNIVVPSKYAQNGKSSDGRKVAIRATCRPQQWIPQYWCYKQFYDLCTSGDSKGRNSRIYNGCQIWYIK